MKTELTNIFVSISGVVMTLTFILGYFQFRYQGKIAKVSNQMKLREMFDTEARIYVHSKLRNDSKWAPSSQEDWVKVDDYLGLFEICEKMLQDKVLDDDMFKSSYLYRIENITNNISINEKLKSDEDWSLFKRLLDRYQLKY